MFMTGDAARQGSIIRYIIVADYNSNDKVHKLGIVFHREDICQSHSPAV